MKSLNYLTVLMILSLLLLTPLTRQPEEINILPKTQSSILKNIRLKTITLTANHDEDVEVKITSINMVNNKTKLVKDVIFFSKLVVKIEKPGFHQFDFLSNNLTIITISESGLSNSYTAIIFTIFTLRLILFLNKNYFTSLDELL